MSEVTGKFPSDPNDAITLIHRCIPDMSDRPNVEETVMRFVRKFQQAILQTLAVPVLNAVAKKMNDDRYFVHCSFVQNAVRRYVERQYAELLRYYRSDTCIEWRVLANDLRTAGVREEIIKKIYLPEDQRSLTRSKPRNNGELPYFDDYEDFTNDALRLERAYFAGLESKNEEIMRRSRAIHALLVRRGEFPVNGTG